MRRKPLSIPDQELAVLRELWRRQEATIRDITEALYPEGTAPQYATVQKLLERLERKGFVDRDRSGRAHRFSARLSRQQFLGEQLQELADKTCNGALGPLLTTLVQARGISEQDRRNLRRLIQQDSKEGDDRPKSR